MYAVVGCSDCDALWVVEGRPETTGCPRCGKRHQFESRKRLATAGTEQRARALRAALLADRGESDLDAAAFAAMAEDIEQAGLEPEEYLERAGIDTEAVAAVEDTGDGPGSREETVRAAIREQETPDEASVVEYATARGVPADAAADLLERLVRSGEATESDGGYRLL